jgi:hypothetical protein
VQAEVQKSPKWDVIAAQAEIQNELIELVSRFRGNDAVTSEIA